MTRGDLVQAFADAGVTLGSGDQCRNIGTTMWRLKDTFVNLDGFGYWLRDKAYGKAGYLPTDEIPRAGSSATSLPLD